MLIILFPWACKEANFGSLRDSRSASSLPGQELLLWNSSVELAPGGGELFMWKTRKLPRGRIGSNSRNDHKPQSLPGFLRGSVHF